MAGRQSTKWLTFFPCMLAGEALSELTVDHAPSRLIPKRVAADHILFLPATAYLHLAVLHDVGSISMADYSTASEVSLCITSTLRTASIISISAAADIPHSSHPNDRCSHPQASATVRVPPNVIVIVSPHLHRLGAIPFVDIYRRNEPLVVA